MGSVFFQRLFLKLGVFVVFYLFIYFEKQNALILQLKQAGGESWKKMLCCVT